MLTDLIVKCYGDTHDLPNLSDYKSRHCYMLVFTCYLLRFKLWDKFLLAIAHAPASAQAMFWSTCIHSHLKTSSQRIGVQWILFPEYFWIPRQKLPKSLYFEKNKVRRSDMLSSYTQKNKYLKLSMTSLFTLQSDYENSLKFNTGFNEEPFHLFPKYFWILRLKFPNSFYFEKNKVRRSDMQSSTDLCVTVQLYTQVSACCWLGS